MASEKLRVSAPSDVLGYAPGETFEADLDPVLKQRLTSSGALTVLSAPSPAPKPAVSGTPATKEKK